MRLGEGDGHARRLGAMTTDLGLPPVLDPESAKNVLLAAPRGYCAGVDRAVITVEKALDLYGAPVYVRKQIVHNKHVVANLESRGAIFVEELDEVPEGQTVVFSAHGVSPAVHAAGRRPRPQDHRRDLPAGDQGPPRGQALRQRRLRHPPHRPRGPRGGRGHRRRGARPHPARAEPRRRRRHRRTRPREGRVALADHAERRRDPRDRRRDPGEVPAAARPAERRHLLRHPEPPARGQGDLAERRPGDRGRLAQLLQLGAPGRGRARGRRQGVVPRRRPHRDRRGLARRRRHRLGDLRRLGAGGPGRGRARLPRPSAATPTPAPSTRPRSR